MNSFCTIRVYFRVHISFHFRRRVFFMNCRDQNSKFRERWHSMHTLLWFSLAPRTGGLYPLAYSAIGFLRMRADDAFQSPGFLSPECFPPHRLPTEVDFASWECTSVSRVESLQAGKFEDCASIPNPYVNDWNRSQYGLLHFLLSLTVSRGC